MMKNPKLTAFLNYLESQNDWVTASALANHFQVSTRTIRNYVSDINKNTVIISSSPSGYKLNTWNEQEKETSSPTQDTPSKRMSMILKELILHTAGLDIFDLSEKIYVSTSTIENDIVNANSLILPFHLKIKRKSDRIILTGEETAKRKLMSHIISQEASPHFLSTIKVQEVYKDYNINFLKDHVIQILERYNLYINEYSINSIILHLVITMDRIKNNESVEQNLHVQKLKSNAEMNAAREIADMIEGNYGISFNEAERYYLVLLLSSKTTLLNYQSLTPDSLTKYVDKYFIQLAQNLLEKVHESYFIDLSDDEFFVKFTLHIRNLVFRAKNNQWSRNPLSIKLKDTYPLIYEISVFISNELKKIEDITIKEDEIAYIAFHVGAFFERKKELESKILCAVVCPIIMILQVNLVQKIEAKFRDSIEIIQVTAETEDLMGNDRIEFIITTLPIKPLQVPAVFIHPYIIKEDFEHIQNLIVKIGERKNILKVKNYLEMFFNEDLFMTNIYLNSAEEYIKFMSQKFYERDYVNKDYCDSVLEREKMSSTAFNNNVAVPHSMKMDANRTGIGIIINDKPVKWGEEQVQIITMIAINNTQRQLFSHVFESFINILSEWGNVKELTKAIDYKDFMEKIARLMDKI